MATGSVLLVVVGEDQIVVEVEVERGGIRQTSTSASGPRPSFAALSRCRGVASHPTSCLPATVLTHSCAVYHRLPSRANCPLHRR